MLFRRIPNPQRQVRALVGHTAMTNPVAICGVSTVTQFSTWKLVKLLKVPVPELLMAPGSVRKLPAVIKKNSVSKVLLGTDKGITSTGLINGLWRNWKKAVLIVPCLTG